MKSKIKLILSAAISVLIWWQCQEIISYKFYGFNSNLGANIGIVLVSFALIYFVIDRLERIFVNVISKYREHLDGNKSSLAIFIIVSELIFLSLSTLICVPIIRLGYPGILFCVLTDLFFGYLGYEFILSKYEIILNYFNNLNMFELKHEEQNYEKNVGIPKILDTSVIIDGRIYDLSKSGFIEGELIIPSFVLEELRHIADSSDALKRNRGRRGLDVLKNIQMTAKVKIEEIEHNDGTEVDTMLLKLAKKINAKVITNDYNLNKVAAVQEVEVLNINELANAIKPIVLPGEEMNVRVMKDGKENGQGVAYLEDGTMIVVEGGKYLIGKTLDVIVTSVLQTAAGRMIFAKPKEEEQVS